MGSFGFTNFGSYASQSPNADAEMCMNLYPESVESGQGNSAIVLYHTPGLILFCNLGGASVRGGIWFNGRAFFVSGTTFWEVFANGTKLSRGTVAADLLPSVFAAGPNQILLTSAGIGYVFNLNTNILAPITPALPPIGDVDYLDGFFVALLAGTNTIQVSNLFDATTWPALATTQVSVFPDIVLSMAVLHREIWLLGIKASTVYYDAGAPIFPFAVNASAGVIEMGSIAAYGHAVMDNTLFWLGQDLRGGLMAWRANGYTPERISTHAEEYAWSQYSKVSDAIAYAYQDQGHTFYQLYFPTANATWDYDVATSIWHQRGAWNGVNFTAQNSQCHVYAFGQHLVGDWASGNVYSMSINNLTDNGNAIRRVRRSPHISKRQQWQFHEQLQVYLESGLGPQPPLQDGNGNPRPPLVSLRWSNDAAHTWSNYYDRSIGFSGEYTKRVIWRRLGRARDRVYELSCSDPVPLRIIDSYLFAEPDYPASERIATQLRKVS